MPEEMPSAKGLSDLCFAMVTCNKEAGRFFLLQNVTRSLKEDKDWNNWEDRFFVFDNDSSYKGSREFIESNFKNVFWSKKNYGFWTATSWFCDKAAEMGFKYLYLIESDCVHYDIGRIALAYKYLSENPQVGVVRTQKFSVENRHLYDKRRPQHGSVTTDWCVQHNMFTSQDATFDKTDVDGVYATNMVAKMPALHRVDTLRLILDALKGRSFNEIDFQRESFKLNPTNAILDNGIFNCFLSSNMRQCAGSYIEQDNDMGYIPTRTGMIHQNEEVELL